MDNRCENVSKIGSMSEKRRCIRLLNHSGYHTPDLAGLVFGKRKVLRLAQWVSGTCVRWITELNGIESDQQARSLISGTSGGKRLHQHGFRNGPEYMSVMNHYALIFSEKRAEHKYYNGMPFCDDWNPKKGGDLWKGAKWIIDNLGPKPGPKWSLDIIKHAEGFVPGNLRWAKKYLQMRNQQHRFLETISEEEFAVEARRRGYVRG
jgi:hypothetical protein